MGVRLPVVTSTVRMSAWVAGGEEEANGGMRWRMNVNFPTHLGDENEFAEGAQEEQGCGVHDVEGEDFGA